jgi:hypothetical protein
VALALMFPETVTDAWLRHLIHGTPAQRAAGEPPVDSGQRFRS